MTSSLRSMQQRTTVLLMMRRSLYRWPSRIACRSYGLRGGRDGTDTFTGNRTRSMMLRTVCSPPCICSSCGERVQNRPRHWNGRLTLSLVRWFMHIKQGIFVRAGRPRAPPALPSRRSSAVRRDFSRVDWTQSSSAWPMSVNSSPA